MEDGWAMLWYFLVVVIAWVGSWGVIDGIITYIVPDRYPLLRLAVYFVVMLIGLGLYVWMNTNAREDKKLVL